MNTNFLRKGKTWLLVVLFLIVGVSSARAEIELWGDKLTLTGFVRHQLVYNMGTTNPYNKQYGQTDKNWCNLSRTWLISELDYKPNDNFRLYSKMRFIWDQTTNLDSDLLDYDAITFSTPHYGGNMRLGHDNHATAEIWELYGDLDIGNLWIRAGRQQIVWGEMISARILDIVNPLDKSWHFQWEPEEFENIRIPTWMLRGVYNIEQSVVPWLDELYVEAFWNPGDIVPVNNPEIGNAYRLNWIPPVYISGEVNDRRGRDEFGGRIGYKIGKFAGTFNYAYLYTDDAFDEVGMPGPPTIPPSTWPVTETFYPQIDVYGMSLNYAMDPPFNTVITVESTYVPDMPYYDNTVFPGIAIKEADTLNYAINFQRFTSVFPKQPFMNVIFQYQGKWISDHDEVKLTPGPYDKNNICEKIANDAFVLSLGQDFSYKTYKATFVTIWQPDGSYRFNPGFKYSPGDNWRFEIYANWWGGSAFDKANKHQLNYFYYQDEIMTRITYQF
ncbi:MAG: hypothetical protein JRJ20_03805 [Deltaproteobacteria bacterium]|nr:hypothetical protein [Deltaproteobacteria bacterium]